MKKYLFVVLLVLALALATFGLAFADNGPHGGYTPTTDACAGCHRAHTAQAPFLLKTTTTAGLCFSCHGSTATGADTNVEDGLYLERDGVIEVPAEGQVDWGLKGGGFVNAWMNTDFDPNPPAGTVPSTSAHLYDGSLGTAWGNGVIDPSPNPGVDINLDCANCHNPHGRAGTGDTPTYRILRPIPRDSGAATGVDIADPVNKFYTIGDNTGLYWGQSYGTTGTPLSQWCAQCHTRYLAGSGSATTDSGDAIFKYRHTSNGSGGPNCVSCHVAHGTSASMGPNSGSVPYPDGTLAASDDARSSLLRLDSRGVCIQCHPSP